MARSGGALRAKRVLVTGACGFIGSHLCERLVRAGARVTAFVRYTSRGDTGLLRFAPPEVKSALEIVAGDLRDPDAVRGACKRQDIVLHLGALIAIPYSYVHPREVVETNVIGTLNVLEGARAHDVARVVHTSTSEVYGTAQKVPIDEDHPRAAQSPYAASKTGADQIARAYHRSFGTPVVTLRPFNTYGPRQSDRAVIPTIIAQALTADVVKLGATAPTRDLTFVLDTVDGFIRSATAARGVGEEINLGTNQEISIGDLARTIIALVGRPVKIVKEKARLRPKKSEVERLLSDYGKARRLLGWKPAVPLEKGLRETIAFVEKNMDLYMPGTYRV
ncbi:MAG: GDP-mannose 4,6-dehydratase [Myxococcota bacterium]